MSGCYLGILLFAAVGLYYQARLEGYAAGLRYHEQRRRQEVDEQQRSLITGLAREIDAQGQQQCWWGGEGSQGGG